MIIELPFDLSPTILIPDMWIFRVSALSSTRKFTSDTIDIVIFKSWTSAA